MLRAGLTLLLHSLKRVRALLLVMGSLLAAFQVLLSLVARSLQDSNAFEQLSALVPDFVRQLMGPTIVGLMSFSGIITVGYFHIAVMGSLVGLSIALATQPTSEVETRFIDLVLARPLARHWVITRTIALLVICIVFMLMMLTAGTWTGLRFFAPEGVALPSTRLILTLAVNLGALMLCWGGVGLAIGSASRRRTVAGGIAGMLALTTFLLDYIARAWSPAERVAWLSPFRYYSPLDIVMGLDVPRHNIWVLICVAVAGFLAAYFQFSRRDI
jgi:ABC-2 type transport system permease protein